MILSSYFVPQPDSPKLIALKVQFGESSTGWFGPATLIDVVRKQLIRVAVPINDHPQTSMYPFYPAHHHSKNMIDPVSSMRHPTVAHCENNSESRRPIPSFPVRDVLKSGRVVVFVSAGCPDMAIAASRL